MAHIISGPYAAAPVGQTVRKIDGLVKVFFGRVAVKATFSQKFVGSTS